MHSKILVFILLLFCVPFVCAQEKYHKEKSSFGIQIKPIIPSGLFRVEEERIIKDNILYSITPKTGYSAGAMIRFGLSARFTLQTDINYIRRNFTFVVNDNNTISEINLRVVSYEIPVLPTFFVRLSEEVYMGLSSGLSFQFLPTNLYSESPSKHLNQLSLKKTWMSTSFVAQVSFEWRTDDKGYFNIGPTFNMYFNPMYQTRIQYKPQQKTNEVITDIGGDYFGIVLRYTFDPDK